MIDRFQDKYFEDVYTGCFQWIGATRKGYGAIGIKGNLHQAHRVAWEDKHGPVPEGLFVCHKCDNRGCVNTEHLFLGTPQDNLQDAVNKGRTVKGERHGAAKLYENQVIAILKDGESHRDIAKKFNVSKSIIQRIRAGIKWKHISRDGLDNPSKKQDGWSSAIQQS